MTKDEIRALISAKVAGQGDQVDAGGALAGILNAIIDAIPEGNAFVRQVDITGLGDLSSGVKKISTALSAELQRNVAIECLYSTEIETLLRVSDAAVMQALMERNKDYWEIAEIFAVFGRLYYIEDGTIDTMDAVVLYSENGGDICIRYVEI